MKGIIKISAPAIRCIVPFVCACLFVAGCAPESEPIAATPPSPPPFPKLSSFVFPDAAKEFSVRMDVAIDEGEFCFRCGCPTVPKITLIDRTDKEIQSFEASDLSADQLEPFMKYPPQAVTTFSSEEQTNLFATVDLNFDGFSDFVVNQRGSCKKETVPQSVYLFDKTTGRFVLHERLTSLLSAQDMYLSVLSDKKILSFQRNGGIGQYLISEYKFGKKGELVDLCHTFETPMSENKVRVETQCSVNGKPVGKVRFYDMDKYYEDKDRAPWLHADSR